MINEILDNGMGARITVTGNSMRPFLYENIDSVELQQSSFKSICKGDIVIILRDNGEYVMHRVLKKHKDCFYIVGDAQWWVEGPIRPNQITAVVKTIWRDNKKIKCSSFYWRSLSLIWLWMLPFRKILFKAYSLIRKIWGSKSE